MRRIIVYIHQLPNWPEFHWNAAKLAPELAAVRNRQGRLLGRMEHLQFNLQAEAAMQTLTLDV
jgi:Fic family protein